MQRKITVRLDRLRVISWAKPYWKLRPIPGFKVVRDTRVTPQGKSPSYERVRELVSLASGTRVWWQYRPRRGWLKGWRITWVGDDQTGIQPMDILRILKVCRYFRFILVELAFDFDSDSRVDRRFVQRHGRFGKSHLRRDRGGPEQIRYGSRKSGKLVRCYWKNAVNAFRVELEVHGRILAKNRHPKRKNYNFDEVPNAILPHHVRDHVTFVSFRWEALEHYLTHRFGPSGKVILQRARGKARISLQSVSQFLRRQRVPNIHRFLFPIRINREIDEALTRWAVKFQIAWSQLL